MIYVIYILVMSLCLILYVALFIYIYHHRPYHGTYPIERLLILCYTHLSIPYDGMSRESSATCSVEEKVRKIRVPVKSLIERDDLKRNIRVLTGTFLPTTRSIHPLIVITLGRCVFYAVKAQTPVKRNDRLLQVKAVTEKMKLAVELPPRMLLVALRRGAVMVLYVLVRKPPANSLPIDDLDGEDDVQQLLVVTSSC